MISFCLSNFSESGIESDDGRWQTELSFKFVSLFFSSDVLAVLDVLALGMTSEWHLIRSRG